MGGTGREQRGVRRQQGAREARLPKKPNSTEEEGKTFSGKTSEMLLQGLKPLS